MRSLLGGEGVLYELLRDGRGALLGRAGEDVLVERAGDALVVDAAVLVEAAVLDRDDRLLHDGGDLVGLDEHAALVVRERGEAGAVAVDDDRVLGALELGAVLERREVARDGRHDAEDPGDECEEREAHEDESGAELFQTRLGARLVGCRCRRFRLPAGEHAQAAARLVAVSVAARAVRGGVPSRAARRCRSRMRSIARSRAEGPLDSAALEARLGALLASFVEAHRLPKVALAAMGEAGSEGEEALVARASPARSMRCLTGRLEEQLASGKELRVKFGMDPTSADIHLGHTVVLQKLRTFQDLGHTVVLIVGDYTARVGDPSGRSDIRPVLSPEEIEANALTYQEQAFKVLDRERTEVRHNSEWLEMPSGQFFDLVRRFTVARLLERDDFQKRMEAAGGDLDARAALSRAPGV